MRYDDDTYLNEEADNDLWDDELELSSDSNYGGFADYGIETEPGNPDQHDHSDSAENDYYSDPEPETEPEPEALRRPRRRGLFSRQEDPEEDEEERTAEEEDDEAEETDEETDYYDSVAPTRRPKAPKMPKLDPEDPDYWIAEEESPLKEIMPGPVKKWKWMLAAVGAFLLMTLFAWIWFLRPYTDSAVKYGYIKHMERRGSLIKTFEGTMIPYKELGDPDPFYFQEVKFSVESDSLAAHMKRMMLGCVPVRVEYEMYHAPLPWKGEAKMIILKADTADPRKILPPEYRSKY